MKYRLVGKIKEAHGLKGEAYVLIFSKEWPWLKKATAFILYSHADQGKAPETLNAGTELNLQSKKEHKDGLIVSFEGITSRTDMEKILGQFVYIDQELLSSKKGERIFLRELQDFELEVSGKIIGRVVAFSSNGPQDLLVVDLGEKKATIPFVEPWIQSVNFEMRKIVMEIPEGLLDL